MLSVSSFFSKATSHLKWFVDAPSLFYFFYSFQLPRPSGPTDLKIPTGGDRRALLQLLWCSWKETQGPGREATRQRLYLDVTIIRFRCSHVTVGGLQRQASTFVWRIKSGWKDKTGHLLGGFGLGLILR